jgi:OOP family OmpA-OmpF porin
MRFRIALLTATVLAAPFALPRTVSAQPVTGPYLSGGMGYSLENTQTAKNITANNVTVPGAARIVLHNGYTGQVSLGYGFGNGFRAEVEGDYIHNNFSKAKFGGTDFPANGSEARYGVFVNAVYDFDVGSPYLYPYLGGGVGWQEDSYHGFDPADTFFNKTKSVFAYQLIAGLAFPIAPVPGLSATLEYRLVALPNSRKFNGSFARLPVSITATTEYNNQILVGFRYEFFPPVPPAPPPAPVPVAAPAPAPAQTYLIFFDWDKYNLTQRATQIIAQAASDSKTSNVTTLNVSGYTDTSGTAVYNQGLSMRRAKAVAAQLVTDGVPASEIEIHAFGETHLLVPTGPGVREPQNRRVEIILQ